MKSLIATVAALSLTACGGGGIVPVGGADDGTVMLEDTPRLFDFAITVELPLIESYSLRSGNPYVKNPSVWIGDSATFPGEHYVGFFRFDLSVLPAGAKIQSAYMTTQRQFLSNDSDVEAVLGQMHVDSLIFEGLDLVGPTAFGEIGVGESDIATLNPTINGYVANMYSPVQFHNASSHDYLNIRIHWTVPYVDNGVMDAYLFDFQDSRATLRVTYKP